MNKPRFLTEPFGVRSLSVVLALILLPIITVSQVAPSQENEDANRQKAIRVVQTYMQTGQKEYNEGFFEESVITFLMAQKYEEYLPVAMREQLNELLKKSWIAVLEETFREVIDLIQRDRLSEAKTYLEKIKDNEFLTKEERIGIDEIFRRLDAQIIAELWKRSIRLYSIGQYEKARVCFIQIASSELITPDMRKTVEGYLAEIDKLLGERAKQKLVKEEKPEVLAEPNFVEPGIAEPNLVEPGVAEAEVVEADVTEVEVAEVEVAEAEVAEAEVAVLEAAPKVASPVTGQSSYIEVINRKRNIIRSHTRAVVNDAIAKARSYIKQARFDKAKNVVETAALTVNKNQMHLGEALFKEYSSKLEVLTEEIVEKENEEIRQAEQEKRKSATEAQRRFREQMEIDRKERIAELMENALTYQKQQRYEAALGQLVSLLALDPQNEQALVMKDTLEDLMNFRKQLEVKKESDKQRVAVLQKTDESGIPYAEELTYPPYWRELVEKPTRQPDKPIGLDPLDAEVYKQLEKPIDLLDLTPAMSFGEVIERLKNSVEPPIQIQPNWKDLEENAEVDPATAAGMDPLTGVKLRKALEILLAGVSSIDFAELTYVVDEGVILIGTVDMLEIPMVHRVYDISDLVSEPANYGQIGRMMGMQNMMMSGMGGMGGGMMGGMGGGMMGGMGGGGMGGMSGGMGGMGGGMRGGMGGMGGYGQSSGYIAQDLVTLVEESIDPMSWYDLNEDADGSIFPYPTQQPKKLAVYNTPEVHTEIEKLLEALRKSLGHQVSVEARFLVVSENFLEEIGLDVDFNVNLGNKWGLLTTDQDSYTSAASTESDISQSLGGIGASATMSGGYGSILDDLQVSFLLKATQAHRDAKSLNAPRATVLSGETVNFQLSRYIIFALTPLQESGTTTTGTATGTTTESGGGLTPQYYTIQPGNALYITPIITHDKKNVLLNIMTVQNQFLGVRKSEVEIPTTDNEPQTINVEIPETEYLTISTRVNIPDGGTLLLGGQKITSESEIEAGVPVLSKIPILGRVFRNTSKVRDYKILLVLVKSTILLQDEREAEAIGAMENGL